MNRWKKFFADQGGASAVEYGILLGLIIVVSVTTLGGFGVGLGNIYTVIDGALPTN